MVNRFEIETIDQIHGCWWYCHSCIPRQMRNCLVKTRPYLLGKNENTLRRCREWGRMQGWTWFWDYDNMVLLRQFYKKIDINKTDYLLSRVYTCSVSVSLSVPVRDNDIRCYWEIGFKELIEMFMERLI